MNIELFHNFFHSISGHVKISGGRVAEALGHHGHPAAQADSFQEQEACNHHPSGRGSNPGRAGGPCQTHGTQRGHCR